MNQRKILIIFLIVNFLFMFTNPSPVFAITEEYLQHHRTTFENENWFTTLIGTEIANNSLRLKSSGNFTRIYEDLENWIEVDAGTSMSISEGVITHDGNMRYSVNGWFQKGVLSANNYSYVAKINVDTILSATQTVRGTIFSMSEYYEDYMYHINNNYEAIAYTLKSYVSTAEYAIGLQAVENGNSESIADTGNLNVDTDYWVLFNRTGYDLGCYVYSDEDLTTLITSAKGTISVFGDNYSFNKVLLLANHGYATSLNSKISLSNLWNGTTRGGIESVGYAYTKNLLENSTKIAFSLMTNQTICEGGNYELSVSDDNSTWIMVIDDCSGYEWVKLEKYNLTKLYIKIKLTSLGVSNSRLFDLWFTNFCDFDSIPSGQNWGISLVLLALGFIVGLGVLKKHG